MEIRIILFQTYSILLKIYRIYFSSYWNILKLANIPSKQKHVDIKKVPRVSLDTNVGVLIVHVV